jgi:hypothetical protein
MQVMIPSACSFIVLVVTVLHLAPSFTLHVSAYIAIFKCVGFSFASKSREADFFRNTKIKTSYTLEDDHVGQNL